MQKIVTTDEMRAIEKTADESGLSYDMMMQNAGKAVADAIQDRFESMKGKRVVILVGTGNNGGDGLVVGHHLLEAGAQIAVYLAKERPEGDENLIRLKETQILITTHQADQGLRVLKKLLQSADVVIDSLLGTGFRLPLKGSLKDLLSASNNILTKRMVRPMIIAVDCPSALDCDTGEMAEETIYADLTVTLAAAKPGLLIFPGAAAVGNLVIGDIGIPADQEVLAEIQVGLADEKTLSSWLPERPRNAHKGTFGRVIVVAGSINYPGAAELTALAAYRVGAGLVTMAVPSVIQALLAPRLPEATWILLPHELGVISENGVEILQDEISRAEAIVLGPGFGQEHPTRLFLTRLIGAEHRSQRGQIGFVREGLKSHQKSHMIPPCVIDADGLKLLTGIENWSQILPQETVLTPHPGELALMTGLSIEAIQKDRIMTARHWAKTWGHILVLKGAFTVVAAPDGRATVIPIASPALARAGTGDVLAGAIAGLRAQGLPGYEAAVLGSYIHGCAGMVAADRLGTTASVLAGEVAEAIPVVLNKLESQR